MADLYKLEWMHSIKTIQDGLSADLNKFAFLDTIVVCQDGLMSHNKLLLGLMFPELSKVTIFDLPQEQTLIMPDYTVSELQSRISDLLPEAEIGSSESVGEDEIAPVKSPENFDSFLETDVDLGGRGARRGRGRPPLTNRMPSRFTCDYCNKGFFYRSMLTAHEKLHTGGSRETCELCGAEYSTRQNLKNHMIKQHGEDSFTPRKRGRPPLDPDRRAAFLQSSSMVNNQSGVPHPLRPHYRGRGRPPLMTKHAGLTHYDNYSALVRLSQDSFPDNDDMSAESFMEQKMEDDLEEGGQRHLNFEKEKEPIQSSSELNSKETEDIKPDISQLVDNNQHARNNMNNRITDSNTNTNFQESAMTNSFNNPGQMNDSFTSNPSMYPGVNFQQNFQQLQQHLLQQQQNQQSTSQQQNFYPHESQMSGNSNSFSENSNQEQEYQIELKDVQKLSILTKPELVSICKRNNISVTGEKQALAARILRKLGKIFDDETS